MVTMISRFERILVLGGLSLVGCAHAPARQFAALGNGSPPLAQSKTLRASHAGVQAGDDDQPSWTSTPLPPPRSKEEEPSFCRLNPGGCPPLPSAEEPDPGELEGQAHDPWKSFACIQACEAGAAAMERFCQALPDRTKRQKEIRAACWGVSRGSKAACVVFCRAYFGPPRTP
ncbi:hypothetical protein DB31_6990 [Hyalangium minutum]|uniref:Lipoprotein n=1 Tax=Hyalangium minutum TaxID=394096 RepID=A0A085WN25_9BACT|nr:hypothetical protein DB31_6990 [Hyalangium minutum]